MEISDWRTRIDELDERIVELISRAGGGGEGDRSAEAGASRADL